MRATSLALAQKAGLSFLYLALIVFYCVLYAPFGLENNDGGFILGLSRQFSEGARIYEDIAYIRPPVSIIFHSLSFISPLDAAPILSSRIIYFLQIGIYSAVAAALVSNQLKLSPIALLILASASFIFSAHNFPPMAWHTVDGIFFSVLALFFAQRAQTGTTSTSFIGALLAFILALLAGLSKQPFYIAPILVGLIILYPLSVRKLAITALAAICGSIILYFILASLLNVNAMISAIGSQTSIRDLVSAGIVNYMRDWYSLRSIITVGPLAGVLLSWIYGRVTGKIPAAGLYLQIALVLSVLIFMMSVLQMFLAADRWISPRAMLDSLFTITTLVSIVESIRTRHRSWLMILALHGVSWAASISWGYTTIALFSAPSIIVVTIAGMDILEKRKTQVVVATATSVAAAVIFFIGNQFLYSLEGPVKRSDSTVSLGDELPALTGIRITATQAAALKELQALRSQLGVNLIVLPNWPLYNTIFGGRNPIGMDWLLNTEVGPFDQVVRSRLDQVEYTLVFRNASPSPTSEGRFGSQITQSVTQNWVLLDVNAEHFQVYSNPLH